MLSDYRDTDTRAEIPDETAVPPVAPSLSETGIGAMQGLLDTDTAEQPSEIETLQETTDARALQEQDAIEALQQVEGIHPEAWQVLDESERAGTLQNIEGQMAAVQGRPPAEVDVYPDPPGECGYYDLSTNQIHIADRHLMNDEVHEVVDTTVHEGRHAYQQYAIEHPGFHDNPEEVQAWRENLQDYRDAGSYGQEIYQKQPVETDARSYSQRITDGVYGGIENE